MVADCVIGVDLGGTKLLAGVVDRKLAVHHRARRSSRGRDAAEVLDTVERSGASVGAITPCVVAECDDATYDELIRPHRA